MLVQITCASCGASAMKKHGAVNRAQRAGLRIFCGRKCAGIGRRKNRTDAQKKTEKAAYDRQYRASNIVLIKAKKAAWFKATYDPDAARIDRKKRAAAHVEYCRQPEYREWKRGYDQKRRSKAFGEYAESHILLIELEKQVISRMSRYDIYAANGTLNKALKRKRNYV